MHPEKEGVPTVQQLDDCSPVLQGLWYPRGSPGTPPHRCPLPRRFKVRILKWRVTYPVLQVDGFESQFIL